MNIFKGNLTIPRQKRKGNLIWYSTRGGSGIWTKYLKYIFILKYNWKIGWYRPTILDLKHPHPNNYFLNLQGLTKNEGW